MLPATIALAGGEISTENWRTMAPSSTRCFYYFRAQLSVTTSPSSGRHSLWKFWRVMLAASVLTLASARATTMDECGELGVTQLQTVRSLFAPVILGPTWKGMLVAVCGLLG